MANAWRVTYQQAGPSVQMIRVIFFCAASLMPEYPFLPFLSFSMSIAVD